MIKNDYEFGLCKVAIAVDFSDSPMVLLAAVQEELGKSVLYITDQEPGALAQAGATSDLLPDMPLAFMFSHPEQVTPLITALIRCQQDLRKIQEDNAKIIQLHGGKTIS
jgi:hypothetical protein